MKLSLFFVQVFILFTVSQVSKATFVAVSDQELRASCYEGSPMLMSDVCFGKTYEQMNMPNLSQSNTQYYDYPLTTEELCAAGAMGMSCTRYHMNRGLYNYPSYYGYEYRNPYNAMPVGVNSTGRYYQPKSYYQAQSPYVRPIYYPSSAIRM